MPARRLDFSDYLELRRERDLGRARPDADERLAHLEKGLGVTFAGAVPLFPDLRPGPGPFPRELRVSDIHVVFQMREEVASLGRTRQGLHGFDLPEGAAVKDFLDFIEEERKVHMEIRKLLRTLDRKIWAVFTGERKMPECDA
ncbi:MAG TPA: hypothetical protein VI997_12080 [Candidatus Thermoplasmatota archaeon]|nr:hypothetical protein [Candidatus Thermoplasmatota archaeon]